MRLSVVVAALMVLASGCGKFRLPTEPTVCATESGGTGEVNGTVITESGIPIPDALIHLGALTMRTDAAGRFAMEAASGSSPLEIEAPGYVRSTGEITVTRGSSTVRAVLPASFGSRILFGRVLERCSGRPIAGARVGLPNAYATSAADGTYVLGGVGGGTTFDFRVERSGYTTIGPGSFRLFGPATARDYLMERE